MTLNIVVHSFVRDSGKTNLTTWLAALSVAAGWRVGVVEADIPLPELHTRFHLAAGSANPTINDYLLGRSPLGDAAAEVSSVDDKQGTVKSGSLWFVPASTDPADINGVLHERVDVTRLGEGFATLAAQYELDILFVSAPAGLDEISLSCIALADILLVALRPDKGDTYGTSVVLDLAHQLNVPDIQLVVNRVPEEYDRDQVRREVEAVYGHRVPVVLTVTDEAELLFAGRISALERPASPLSSLIEEIKAKA